MVDRDRASIGQVHHEGLEGLRGHEAAELFGGHRVVPFLVARNIRVIAVLNSPSSGRDVKLVLDTGGATQETPKPR